MKIVTIGKRTHRRRVGAPVADAGHEVDELGRDAGFGLVRVGDLTRARAFEGAVRLLVAATPQDGAFYRFAVPGEL